MRTLLRRTTQIFVCWCAAAGIASAQMIDLSSSAGRRMVDGAAAGGRAGAWLTVGDLTGDYWIKELVVGSPDEGAGRGAVRVFISRPQASQSMLTAADVLLTGEFAGDRFGDAVDAGYVTRTEVQVVNGNPVGTIPPRNLVVGAPAAEGGRGAVYVFPGPFVRGGNRLAANAAFKIIGAVAGDNLGTIIESADLNGDRFREVILAVPSRGIVYVVDLRAATSPIVDLAVYPGKMVITGLSTEIALATGDVSADGLFDLALGDPNGGGGRGAVYLFRGRAGLLPAVVTLPAEAEAQAIGTDVGDRFGAALWSMDLDVFRDVGAELVVGAPGGDGPANARPDAGEVSVIVGRPDITAAFTPTYTLVGAAPGHRLGTTVTAGFVTRRVLPDIAMTAPGANNGSGEVFVFYGKDRFTTPRGTVDMATSAGRRVVADEAVGPIETVRLWEATGEGAEEIVIGVPNAMSSAGRVYLALSPRLDFPTTTVSVRVAQCVPAVREISIENPSVIAVPWQLNSPPPWLRTWPASGTTVVGAPGRMRLIVDTTGVPAGVYNQPVEFISRSPDLVHSGVVNIQLTVDPPSTFSRNANADFNGDGCSDVSIFRPSTGGWFTPGRGEVRFGALGDVPVAGDYDGDAIADIANLSAVDQHMVHRELAGPVGRGRRPAGSRGLRRRRQDGHRGVPPVARSVADSWPVERRLRRSRIDPGAG